MEEFALIKSRVNLNRVNWALAFLISDIKAFFQPDPSSKKYDAVVSIHKNYPKLDAPMLP